MGRIQNLSLNDQKYIGTKFSEDKPGHHYGNKPHIDRWTLENDAQDVAEAIAHPQIDSYLLD